MDIGKIKCLILDDSKVIRDLMKAITETELGVEASIVVESVDQAFQVLDNKEITVDVIFCDLNMPDVDGVEFLRLLAQRKYTGHIVIVSSVSHRVLKSVEQLARTHHLNLLGTIIKPVSVQSVKEMLLRMSSLEKKKVFQPSYERIKIHELVKALEHDFFECYYQPQVSAISRKVVGFEVLSRLNHPTRGLILPGTFISELERHLLIWELTKAQLIQVIQQWTIWHERGENYHVAVNISAVLLNDLDLPAFIIKQLAKHQMPAEYLTLEITESCLNDDVRTSLEVLSRLSMNGINLSIDDFGMGYSSIERLQGLPFNEVKIDQSFVQNATAAESERPVLDSMIGMAKRLGMKVVLEGVETLEHWRMVCHSGCDCFQGFFIARPMSIKKLDQWLRDWEAQTD